MKKIEIINKLFLLQDFPPRKKNLEFEEASRKILDDLGININSEFYELYSQYFLYHLNSDVGVSDIVDVYQTNGFQYQRVMAHKNWCLPKNYILFTTGEGEGGYLYNTEDEKVYDFDLGQQEALLRGELPHWDSFYDFMIWYLTPNEDC